MIFRVEHLFKRYAPDADYANRDIGFTIGEGEVFCLLGDNGSGKTTLVRQLVGLSRPTSGTIEFAGIPIHVDPGRIPLMVGYMPQDADSLNHLTVAEAFYYTAHLRGMSRSEARRECGRLLDIWGLESLKDKDNATLSGGMRRIMRLALATAGSPPVVVLDEPTNDLDPLRRRQVWNLLGQMNRKQGVTILFVTHDLLEAEKVVHRVGILHRGALIAIGRPDDLKREAGFRLRVEIRYKAGTQAGILPDNLSCEWLDENTLTAHGNWPDLLRLLAAVGPECFESIRIHTVTLEDLYIHHVTRT